jgi:hypothetical protein
MRLIVLTGALALLSGVASAEQTCTTRADGSYNCTTTIAQSSTSTTIGGGNNHRVFAPDDTGLLRVPTRDGEMLFHCDNSGPCKEIGLNPTPINRQ